MRIFNLKNIYLVLMILCCNACITPPESERLYLKIVELPEIRVEWFFYSYISNTSPDFLIAYYNDNIDTICIADEYSILNFDILEDEIKISTNGTTTYHGNPILIPNQVSDFKITIDSSFVLDSPRFRSIFKRKNFNYK